MSNQLVIPYITENSNVFRKIRRPRLTFSIYSKPLGSWITIENVLADTGADISVLPKGLGQLMVGKIKRGEKFKISGLVPWSTADMYMHILSIRIGGKRYRTTFAISASDEIPPTLGRIGGLDNLDIRYQKGRQIIINW
jgi:hypothetical protein